MSLHLIRGMLLLAALCITGCAPSGGTVGDENDPAETTDVEVMAEETGDAEL